MDPGACVPVCVPKGGINARKVQKYDPKTQCCGVQGVMGKTENFAARLCKDDKGNSTLKPRPGYKPTSNGCGSEDFDVGDGFTFEETIRGKTRTGSVSFTKACNAHDRCYGTCRADKKECDDAFRKAMRRRCKATFSGKDEFSKSFRDQCLEQAALYRLGVSFADSEYWAAQTEACHCC